MKHMIARVSLITLTLLLLVQPAAAQFKGKGAFGGLGGSGQDEFGDSRDRVSLSATPSRTKVSPGADLVVAIVFDHQPNWHSWTNQGNVPQGMAAFDGAINTEIKLKKTDADHGVQAHIDFIQWPKPYAARADVGEGPKDYATFAGRAIAYLPVTISPDAQLGQATLELLVTFQACDDSTCLMPVFDYELPVQLEVVSVEAMAAGGEDESSLQGSIFSDFDPAVFSRILAGDAGAGSAASSQAASNAATAAAAASSVRPTFFGIELPRTDGPVGLVLLALLSMVGGFILNLTPCVLPIIPIKIMTISHHAGTPGRSFVLGAWMALGVVAFWAAIGIPAAFVSAWADPSRIFGIWWLTLGIGLLIGAMGVGIMGLFTIQLPAAAYAINPKADTSWGSFLFGVMTGVLGLPCFGFVAGALLAGSATLPASTILIIFTSMGIGMAAPYLVLSAKPALVNKIPRTGPASELVKQVMGLLLLAAAAYFVGSGLIALVSEYPALGRQLHWWAVALFATCAGLWLIIRTFQITRRPQPRVVFSAIGLVLSAAAVAYAFDSTQKALSQTLWQEFSPAAFADARASNKVIVMDFTAEWCLTCKTLKATVLNREPVSSALKQKDVVAFTVDLTSTSAPGWQMLRDLGKTGIPLLAIYPPGSDTPWLANAYTPDQVVEALEQARTKQQFARSQ